MENVLTFHGCDFSLNHLLVCLQVIKWIEEHGETFLLKHTGVGKSLVKAEALLKRHEEFESIAQVSEFGIEILHSCWCTLLFCYFENQCYNIP